MLIRLLLLCALIAVLVVLIQHFRRQSAARQKILKWQLALGIIALMLIVLAVTGRIHWLGALFATALAFFRQLIPLLLKWSPAIKQLYQHYQQQRYRQQHAQHQSQQQHSGSKTSTPDATHLQRREALKILGLEEGASRDEIIQAHRKLMQKVHPDRGGSAELAAQVNRAKDILLG